MSSKILMPSGGQTTDELVIQKWYKQEGDYVKRGDVLFEIETDKAILEVESFAEGTLLEVRFQAGVMVKTGEVVALIGDASEKATALAEPTLATAEAAEQEAMKPASLKSSPALPALSPSGTTIPGTVIQERITASPLAKSLARSEQVDLQDVAAFSSKSILKKKDVEAFIARRTDRTDLLPPGNFPAPVSQTSQQVIALTPMRRTIARRMKESLSTAPHFVAGTEVDMTAAIRLRRKFNAGNGDGQPKVSFNDIIMKAVASALASFPLVNASFDGERIYLHADVNFGLAVSVDGGIVVPVLPAVNRQSLSGIAAMSSSAVTKARDGQLRETDLTGGTITLSNLGMFGLDFFTAIINQPESCILATGGILKKVVVVEDEMVIREMMSITASFDHRVIDGAEGAGFLMKVKALLEDPELLLF